MEWTSEPEARFLPAPPLPQSLFISKRLVDSSSSSSVGDTTVALSGTSSTGRFDPDKPGRGLSLGNGGSGCISTPSNEPMPLLLDIQNNQLLQDPRKNRV
jgi:hypothetical protein